MRFKDDKKQKKNKLVSFIECVKNDKFYMANSCFELSIDKRAKLNGLHRETYVGDTISEVVDLIIPKTQSDSKVQQRDIEIDSNDIAR